MYALTPFDRDGAAAEYAAVPASLLAPKPRTLDHVESAAIPLAALSAWQGLFDHGRLEEGERVLIHGAAGGVGHFAVQLARWRGAHVIGTASPGRRTAREFGADEVLDARHALRGGIDPVDLVFDTVGGELLARSPAVRSAGRAARLGRRGAATDVAPAIYFVVEPNREQLVEIARLVDERRRCVRRSTRCSRSPRRRAAFERSMARGQAWQGRAPRRR